MNQKLFQAVKEQFDKRHAPGHDFRHVKSVSKFAGEIAKSENYDVLEAETAGILHDIGRTVTDDHKGHAKAGLPLAEEFLNKYTDFDTETKIRILDAIEHHSDKSTTGKLANILQDADKLDGMGAIGILRAASSKHNLPEFDNEAFSLTAETAGDDPQTLYEQILYTIRWMSMIYTDYAKKVAQERYEFMIDFLEQLKREANEPQ